MLWRGTATIRNLWLALRLVVAARGAAGLLWQRFLRVNSGQAGFLQFPVQVQDFALAKNTPSLTESSGALLKFLIDGGGLRGGRGIGAIRDGQNGGEVLV